MNAFINIKRMEELNWLERILLNKLLDSQAKSSKSMKKEFIPIVTSKILLLTFSQFGQSSKVVQIKIIKSNSYISHIQHKF